MILSFISDTWEWASAVPFLKWYIFSLSTISNALDKVISSFVSSSVSSSFSLIHFHYSHWVCPQFLQKAAFPSQIDLDKQDLHLHWWIDASSMVLQDVAGEQELVLLKAHHHQDLQGLHFLYVFFFIFLFIILINPAKALYRIICTSNEWNVSDRSARELSRIMVSHLVRSILGFRTEKSVPVSEMSHLLSVPLSEVFATTKW